jgi:hypothetical protein
MGNNLLIMKYIIYSTSELAEEAQERIWNNIEPEHKEFRLHTEVEPITNKWSEVIICAEGFAIKKPEDKYLEGVATGIFADSITIPKRNII